ncbi:MAG: ABC transporter ATP-binding protein/permease [Ignavibacteria bacterium]|nr:ABC transporter ATP-binding protein/permease [Ignavibacteria bacterium]
MIPNPLDRLRFLKSYVAQWKREIALSLLSLAFVSASSLVFPWLLKLMVDSFTNDGTTVGDITLLAIGLLMIFIVSSALGYYQQITLNTLGLKLRNQLRGDFYRDLLSQTLAFHRSQQVGELSSRATEDIGKVQHLFTSVLAPITQNLLVVAGGLALTFLLNPLASLVLFLLIVLPLPFVMHFSSRIRGLAASSQTLHATANAYFEESLVAIREVKSMANEERETNRYISFLDRALALEIQSSRLIFRGSQSAYLLLSIMLLVMFYLAGIHALPGWTLGSMVAFYFYAYTIAMAVLSIGRIYLTFQNVSGALGRVEDLLKPGPEGFGDPQGASHELQGSIQLTHVTFGYNKTSILLDDISLEISEGDWIVVSGPSGSGKSTIANLLVGFYRPLSGVVSYDGRDIRGLDIRRFRRQIGFVGQDPFLFQGTLRENLLVTGDTDMDLDRVIEAACLTGLISELPEGLETVIGERGYTLSGGQKSRIAVARALVNNPRILVLDEANAMLETALEKQFWQNLYELRRDKTTIILSHHFEQIPQVDKFMAIRNGSLIEQTPPMRAQTR